MGDSQQIKDSPNTRKGAVLIANPLKILKVDPIYGGFHLFYFENFLLFI